jgi:hypothetical protein
MFGTGLGAAFLASNLLGFSSDPELAVVQDEIRRIAMTAAGEVGVASC